MLIVDASNIADVVNIIQDYRFADVCVKLSDAEKIEPLKKLAGMTFDEIDAYYESLN